MLYYRVKPEYDNCTRIRFVGHSNVRLRHDGILVANELYTARERERLRNADRFFEPVQIPKNKVYWFFDCRFADVDGLRYSDTMEGLSHV